MLPRLFKREGMIFFAWAFLYAAMRFGVSFLRGTEIGVGPDMPGVWVGDDLVFAGLRVAQFIALAIMVVAPLAAAYVLTRRGPARAERRRLARAGPPAVAEDADSD